MSWLVQGLQSLGLGVVSSPFEVGDEVPTRTLKSRGWWWTLHTGTRREGGGAVSVFRADCDALGGRAALARHAFAKTRTLRHPHILSMVDGQNKDGKALEIVTEAVTPLPDWIKSQEGRMDPDQLSAVLVWGLRCVLEALNFLHTQNLCHGMVCMESIFVTKAGDFKLWGLDIIANMDSPDRSHFQANEHLLSTLAGGAHFRAPERTEGDWEKISKHFAMSDVWGLGQMIPTIFDDAPSELMKIQKKMVTAQPLARAKVSRILAAEYFVQHPYVGSLLFIEEMSLKSHAELVAFFRGLAASLASMPTATRIYKVIPALKSGIERSIGPDRRPEDCREVVSATLPVLSDIGSTMTGDEYVAHVLPAVLPLFGVKDRAVRMQLLERIDGLVMHMDYDTVNSTVFESLNAGFADTAKVLRELTLKSMLSLAGKLNEKNLNDRLMRTLSKLQADPEPSIRTNTTIFYGKIAPKLQAGVRVRIIVPAFLRAMKDPFPYARLAVCTTCFLFLSPSYISLSPCCSQRTPHVLPPGNRVTGDAVHLRLQSLLRTRINHRENNARSVHPLA